MKKDYSIIVIGAGAGGLVVAIGLAKAGKKVLLIDKGTWGGDCTNFGCIPSKALIAAAEVCHAHKTGERLGLAGGAPFTETKGVLERVRSLIERIKSHEDPEALGKLGVETLTGVAEFKDAHTLVVKGEKEWEVSGKKIIIATGSSPREPDIEGLKDTPFLTNETIFDLEEPPKRLAVIGAGPIGSELAQAFSRLGSHVSLIHRHPFILNKEEMCARELMSSSFTQEGIELILGEDPKSVRYENDEFIIQVGTKEIRVDQLLVSVGRTPNCGNLNLEAAGVNYSEKGIEVDRFGRTNKKHIWALGDVLGGPLFTHLAENQGRAVLTSLLLPMNKKFDAQPIPKVTYTDPEIASFGLMEMEAEEKYGKGGIAVYHVPFSENDRAITADREEGFVRVVTKKLSSRILGGTIVGPRAGEMLPELSLAAREKIPLRKLAGLIHPYPTYNLAIRKSADLWLTQTFLPWLKNPIKDFPWKRYLPLLLIVALMITAYLFRVQDYFTLEMLRENHHALKEFVQNRALFAPVIFILIYAVTVALSLPGATILTLISGFLFPLPWSLLYVIIGAVTGASGIFLAAKTAFKDVLKRRAGPFLQKVEEGFCENAASYLLFLRLIPLFPFWFVNIAPAFFGISFLTYLWTTAVGIIPGTLAFILAGSGLSDFLESDKSFSLGEIFNLKLRIALLFLGVVSLVPIFVKKFILRRK